MTVGDAVALVDARALRAGRLAQLQAALGASDADACVLFNPANVRYATGATTMTVYCLGSFVRCAVVAPAGRAVLFEHANSMHLFAGIEAELRPFHAWEFFDDPAAEAAIWARETAAALRELGVPDGGRIAVDKIAPVAHAALAAEGFTIVEAGTIVMDARAVKTPEEITLARANGHLVMDMLGAFEAAITPGVRERDLVAVISDVMLRGGGEYLITRGVASGPNTNPWRQEATDRAVAEGDVVFVDTDVNGIEGYFSCVSRTFICGDATPNAAVRETYGLAREWVQRMHELIRPGVGFRELAERAPQLPERFRAQRYECVMHSCGLEDEGPSVSYADAGQPNPDRVIAPGMVVASEVYLGEVGGSFGVKLGDQLLVTGDGIEPLAPYPFDARFEG